MDGLDEKDWNKTIDRYLETGTMYHEDYAYMSDEQKAIIQIIKKSFKRIKYKNEKDFRDRG